jgi:endonuclease/exonuclease/phosphatase family metal-dependent hydrolase
MADALPRLTRAVTPAIAGPDPAMRDAIRQEPPTPAAHTAVLARHAGLFDRVEVRAPPTASGPLAGAARITFWNVERGRFPYQQAALLEEQNAAAHLLCELDVGMARTGQRHTPRDLAARLASGYVYGVEFLELGLGDEQEQAAHAGEQNAHGLHGNAILSPHALERPALIRIDAEGNWFSEARGQRRVGGRIAVLATLRIDDQPVTLASVHLESHGDPRQRGAETAILLEAIDAYADQPVLIGGDFNSSTVAKDFAGNTRPPELTTARVMNPAPFEPLFDQLRAQGYAWASANDLDRPTQRRHPGDPGDRPLGRIDWFFVRGLDALAAHTVPALDPAGNTLSDHEMLTVTVRPAR